jgi:hypothetical protein
MSAHDGHLNKNLKEDVPTTNVGNIQGLKTDPIGMNAKTATTYKKKNEVSKLVSFKEWLESKGYM